jgi:hypothetical protein
MTNLSVTIPSQITVPTPAVRPTPVNINLTAQVTPSHTSPPHMANYNESLLFTTPSSRSVLSWTIFLHQLWCNSKRRPFGFKGGIICIACLSQTNSCSCDSSNSFRVEAAPEITWERLRDVREANGHAEPYRDGGTRCYCDACGRVHSVSIEHIDVEILSGRDVPCTSRYSQRPCPGNIVKLVCSETISTPELPQHRPSRSTQSIHLMLSVSRARALINDIKKMKLTPERAITRLYHGLNKALKQFSPTDDVQEPVETVDESVTE